MCIHTILLINSMKCSIQSPQHSHLSQKIQVFLKITLKSPVFIMTYMQLCLGSYRQRQRISNILVGIIFDLKTTSTYILLTRLDSYYQEEKREKARLAAEKRLAANQTRGTGHPTALEARQKRLEEQERKAIVSGRANQPGNLSVSIAHFMSDGESNL